MSIPSGKGSLNRIDRHNKNILTLRVVAFLSVNAFLTSLAFTLNPLYLTGSVIVLSVCWILEVYFIFRKKRLHLYSDFQHEQMNAPKQGKAFVKVSWIKELFISISSLIYLASISAHLALFFQFG